MTSKESQTMARENISENAEKKKKDWHTFIATAASLVVISQAFLFINPLDLYIASCKSNFYGIPVSRFYDQKNGAVIMMCLILIGFILVSALPFIKTKENSYLKPIIWIAQVFDSLVIFCLYFSFATIPTVFLLRLYSELFDNLPSIWICLGLIVLPSCLYGAFFAFQFKRITKVDSEHSNEYGTYLVIIIVILVSVLFIGWAVPNITTLLVEQKSSYEIMTPRNSTEQFAIIHNYSEDKALVVKARVSCDTCGHKTLLLENSQYFVTDISDATIKNINFGSAKNIDRKVK